MLLPVILILAAPFLAVIYVFIYGIDAGVRAVQRKRNAQANGEDESPLA
jgi:cytochrome bd-type quinol oxidase subunit 2